MDLIVVIFSIIHHMVEIFGIKFSMMQIDTFFAIGTLIWLLVVTIELKKKVSHKDLDNYNDKIIRIETLIVKHIDTKNSELINEFHKIINEFDHKFNIIEKKLININQTNI